MMSGVQGQSMGMAVGAAVGTMLGGPAGGYLGASIGAGGAGFLQSSGSSRAQLQLDLAAIRLNEDQAKFKAAEASEMHTRKFRKALASQMALASMPGRSGSIAMQAGAESMQNYAKDEQAIDMGLAIQETQSAIDRANAFANKESRDTRAFTRFLGSTTSGLNLNLFN